MGFDFIADSRTIINEFANCDVFVGIDSVRGIFGEPSKMVSTFDLSVGTTAPTVSLEMACVVDLGIDSGIIVSIRRDGMSSSDDYAVAGPPVHDGAGLAVVTLTEAP